MTPSSSLAPVAIIGAGPAGLMAAEVIGQAGWAVDVYDAMPSPGRKFLLAGKGGLNITHSEPLEQFLGRYGESRHFIEPHILAFTPDQLRAWCQALGIETFIGSSGKVFPEQMKAAPLLRNWLQRLRSQHMHLYVRHRWQSIEPCTKGWRLTLHTPEGIKTADYTNVIFSLGGASWARLGSDGAWVAQFSELEVATQPLLPSNCGFETDWSEHFKTHFAGEALKNIAARVRTAEGLSPIRRGECMISAEGLEGSLVYAFGNTLRKELLQHGEACLHLDLLPDRSAQWLQENIAAPRGARSMASHLQSKLGLKGVKAGVLRECCDAATYNNPAALVAAIKSLPVRFTRMRPIDEAISTAGGLCFSEFNAQLMLNKYPGIFCAGEMLDWDAPTGGYLLTACMATGRSAGKGAVQYLRDHGISPAPATSV